MSITAMKQALEALQKIYIAPEHEEYIRVWWPACEEAITALRQAIAEAEKQESGIKQVIHLYDKPEQQEPVIWDASAPIVMHPHPAFAPQRQWVGLTDEEMFAVAKHIGFDAELVKLNHDRGMPSLAEQFARAIEAKLRSKNT